MTRSYNTPWRSEHRQRQHTAKTHTTAAVQTINTDTSDSPIIPRMILTIRKAKTVNYSRRQRQEKHGENLTLDRRPDFRIAQPHLFHDFETLFILVALDNLLIIDDQHRGEYEQQSQEKSDKQKTSIKTVDPVYTVRPGKTPSSSDNRTGSYPQSFLRLRRRPSGLADIGRHLVIKSFSWSSVPERSN